MAGRTRCREVVGIAVLLFGAKKCTTHLVRSYLKNFRFFSENNFVDLELNANVKQRNKTVKCFWSLINGTTLINARRTPLRLFDCDFLSVFYSFFPDVLCLIFVHVSLLIISGLRLRAYEYVCACVWICECMSLSFFALASLSSDFFL